MVKSLLLKLKNFSFIKRDGGSSLTEMGLLVGLIAIIGMIAAGSLGSLVERYYLLSILEIVRNQAKEFFADRTPGNDVSLVAKELDEISQLAITYRKLNGNLPNPNQYNVPLGPESWIAAFSSTNYTNYFQTNTIGVTLEMAANPTIWSRHPENGYYVARNVGISPENTTACHQLDTIAGNIAAADGIRSHADLSPNSELRAIRSSGPFGCWGFSSGYQIYWRAY